MRVETTRLEGVFCLVVEPHIDERGSFARIFDAQLLAEYGVRRPIEQCSLSFNPRAGTLRGMHYQMTPYEENKIVRCTRGEIFDVAVDLRKGSGSYCEWFGTELTAANRSALVVPPGVAHGFQTLAPDAEVMYMMDHPYVAAAAGGVRWDDPSFGIEWPFAADRTMSERDRGYPDFRA